MRLEVTKEKPKVKALLIARKQYKNLLNPLYKEYDINIRRIIGRKKSLSLLTEKLDNYIEQTFFVIDINAVAEKRDDLIEQLTFITKKRKDIRIVLFAPEAKPGNADIEYLVNRGFVNIIANLADNPKDKWNKIIQDLCLYFECQCLPPERIFQLVNPKPNPQIVTLSDCAEEPKPNEVFKKNNLKIKEDEKKEHINSIPNYKNTYAAINFYGTQKRIGTTCAALITAAYFAEGKAAVLVLLGSKKEYERLTTFFKRKTAVSECLTEINGIYLSFCGAPITNSDFNIIIRDRGVFREIEEKKSLNVIVGGVSYSEIANTIKAHKSLNENQTEYISMINFADGKPDRYLLDKKSIILPYASDITVFPQSAAAGFNSAFGGLA